MTQDWAVAAFAHLGGDQPATGEPMEQPLPHACSYCGHTEFETPVDNGRSVTATCSNCGGSMSSWGGQWTPELVGDPSNHPSPKIDPASGAGFGQNYLMDPDGMTIFREKQAVFSLFEATAALTPSGKGPVDWDTVGSVYPHVYGDPEVHGPAAEHGDGWGIGDAANHLAHDRPDDPGAEGSSVHDLEFHPYKSVPTEHIDYVRHPPDDPRVARAIQGYRSNPDSVPPLVLVHRHGVYHVADGHHRAAAAAHAGVEPRALIVHSPHPDESFSDGTRGPFHGAEPTGHHTAMPKIRRSRNEEIAEAATVAGTTVYRGLHGDHAHEAAESTRQGVPGGGDHGPGIYVSSSPYVALQHAREHHNDDRGVVMRGRIHPDASVVHRATAPQEAWSGKDANDWARSQGHDVMTNGHVHVVLNPAAVEWEPRNYSVDEGFREFTDVYHHGAFSTFELTAAAERPTFVHDPEDHDVADDGVFIAADTVEASLHRTADGSEQDYRIQHQAPDSDFGAPLHDVEKIMPGFYAHPEWYDHGQEHLHESMPKIRSAQGNPEKKVRIYRSLEAEHAHKGFNTGDWVTTSKSYARDHGKMHDPKHDWPVISTVVPAKHLHTEGDVHEWAYNGPAKTDHAVAFKGGYHQEIRQRADGSIARVQRRPKKEDPPDPLKGFSIQHHEGDVGTDTHRHHVFAYDPEENYAGQLHANHGQEPDSVHVEPQHEGGPLEQRMRDAVPHLRQASKTAAVDWCKHRHLGSCFWPGDNPAPGVIPQRRGACNWTTAWQQQNCPMSDPGPMAGMFVKGAKESALLPVHEAGFKGFVEKHPGDFLESDETDRKYRARNWEQYDNPPPDHYYPEQQTPPVGHHRELGNFKLNHQTDRDLWHRLGQVEDVDLTHGVYATQPYLVREHLKRYQDNPHDVGATQHAQGGEKPAWLGSYPGTHMPMFVRHAGNLFATEGHHRVGAALTRGEKSIKGMVYDADKHGFQNPWDEKEDIRGFQKNSVLDRPIANCAYAHDDEGEARRHAYYHHDDGICIRSPLQEGQPLSFEGALADPELRFHFTATWADVRNKAKRIRREGGVRILMASSEGVVSEVRGDNAIYETTLTYVPGSSKVGTWNCGCRWSAYAWGRSPKYRRFEGRMCSHALAVQYEAQARSAHGREIMPDVNRPDWLKQRTPVVIQHQRDRNLDMTRREVPPGNMRHVFSRWEMPADGAVVENAGSMVDGQLQGTAAVETPCQTPGSQYHTEIGDHQISVTVDLPHGVDITKEQAELLDGNAHNVMELALAPLFVAGPSQATPIEALAAQLVEDGHDGVAVMRELLGLGMPHAAAQRITRTALGLTAKEVDYTKQNVGDGWKYTRPTKGTTRIEDPDGNVHEINEWLHSGVNSLRHPDHMPVPLYHGTSREIPEGSQIEPGHPGNFVKRMKHVYLVDDPEEARKYAGPQGHVYEVKPTGPYGHRSDARGHNWATEHPVNIVRVHSGPQHTATHRLAASVCPECHGPVAPHATVCSHCGARLTPSDVPDVHLVAHNPDAKGSVYLRFGHWPEDERSHNNVTGFKEDGVSVYDLDGHGNPKDPDPNFSRGHEHDEYCDEDCQMHLDNDDYGNDTHEEMRGRVHRAESDRRNGRSHPSNLPHLVKGEMVGIGHDGEPLLRNVKRVGDWIDHRHHFIPGADPHPLARGEHDEGYEPPSPRGRKLAAKEKALPGVAGVVLKALDTGRILMLQRGLEDEKDPARGTWEFPGGHVEDGDVTTLHGAIREWQEEVGQQFPEGGAVVHSWVSPNGVYAGYVVLIPSEKDVSMKDGRVVPNPDDPKGDHHEQAAWWELAHAKKNPALRPECKEGTPWKDIERAGEGMKAASLNPFDLAFAAGYDINSPLQELTNGLPSEPPPHSNSENPASTGFATSEDPDSWADPQATRSDLLVWSSKQEGYNAWRDRLWDNLTKKQEPVPQTGHLYRVMSDEEMQAGRSRGAFHSQDGQGLFVTDDPDRIGRKGGDYGGHGGTSHIIEIDPAKVQVDERPSYYNSRLKEKAVDHVPLHAVTRSWTHDAESGDYLPSNAHRTAMLHDEPEPALPSTDGEREAPLPPGTPAPQRERDALQYGYDDLSEFREDHPELAISSESALTSTALQGSDTSLKTPGEGVAAIVAAFQQTAGAQALATGPQKEDKMDIASAARQFLAGKSTAGAGTPKTALKDFNHIEQQALINEGSHDGTAARNLTDLKIEGTHYSALEAALQEQEKDGVDPTDIFVL